MPFFLRNSTPSSRHQTGKSAPTRSRTARITRTQHARAVLERTAELVVAQIGRAREERGDQVAVARVDLDAVEAGGARALGRVGEPAAQRRDVLLGHDVQREPAARPA